MTAPGGPALRRVLITDVALTLAAAVLLVPLSVALGPATGATRGDLSRAGVAWLALLLVAPLALRRLRPVTSAALVYAFALAQLAVGVWWMPADVAVLVSLYSITCWTAGRLHLVALAAAVSGGLVSATASALAMPGEPVSAVGVWVVVAGLMVSAAVASWAFGLARRARREQLDDLRERAERLERDRDQQAAIAAAAERARIARDMHDVVAHSLSVIIAQADGGRYASTQDPDAGVRALGVIAETGRAALADMRAILGVLRAGTDGSGDGAGAAPGATPSGVSGGASAPEGGGRPVGPRTALRPQPATADLDALVQQTRAAGLEISLVRVGSSRTLPAGVGLTLYRICQEALTNVLKHAGPDPRVTVLIRWGEQDVVLEVSDDGRGASAVGDGAGQGLLGMRERAAMFGGRVVAGPRPGGGYRVRASLPTPRVRDTGPVVVPQDTMEAAAQAARAEGPPGHPAGGARREAS